MGLGDRVHLAANPTTEGRVVRVLDAWHVRVYWLAHPTHARRSTVERIETLEGATPVWLDEAGRPCPTVAAFAGQTTEPAAQSLGLRLQPLV